MSDFTVKELQEWNERIEELAAREGLDFYPQEFEICSYEDMLNYEAYLGMPARYPHWSFGKAFERRKTFYRYNLVGLPYEMVINSNPCIAYLMKDNTLLLQILTMAHVYAHNDFFKNNRLFREGTRAELALEMFKNHAQRVRSYVHDPSIGYEKVERVLDAAHSIRYQTARVIGEKRLTRKEQKKRLLEGMNRPRGEHHLLEIRREQPVPDLHKIPLEPEEDVLGFIAEYGNLEEWEKDIINIVSEETIYFIPQIETKIMNEGWASYWHYHLLNKLELPQGLHLEFLKRHNLVVRPFTGNINPYYLGFMMFADLAKKNHDDSGFVFKVRETERDQSFIRRYLTRELCQEMNLFEYHKRQNDYVVTEISDEKGWKNIRDTLATIAGMGAVPVIKVKEMSVSSRMLVLEHEYDGRDLDLTYALETLRYVANLWGGKVMLYTYVKSSPRILEAG
ncbi:MAG: SpoVR family protein [Syntrophomonadaceae bacterium]|nr:SpoVR family protein [Syntrophomonadaceae bacterium]